MARGFQKFYIYESAEILFGEWHRHIEASGLSLRNPSTGDVTMWLPNGESEKVTINSILEQMSKDRRVSVQWWHPDCRDVFCEIKMLPKGPKGEDCTVISCFYDGYEEDEADALVVIGLSFLFEIATHVFGYVFDDDESSEEFDWDDFFRAGGGPPRQDVVLLGQSCGQLRCSEVLVRITSQFCICAIDVRGKELLGQLNQKQQARLPEE